jgi:hypothetical protein
VQLGTARRATRILIDADAQKTARRDRPRSDATAQDMKTGPGTQRERKTTVPSLPSSIPLRRREG